MASAGPGQHSPDFMLNAGGLKGLLHNGWAPHAPPHPYFTIRLLAFDSCSLRRFNQRGQQQRGQLHTSIVCIFTLRVNE